MTSADPDTRGDGDPPRRGRRPGPDSAREDLIQAARGLFAEVGYDRASVRAIARRAGVDPALVYRFFGSKDGLLNAALQLPFDLAPILAAVDAHPGQEGRTLVRLALRMWRTPQVREQFAALIRAGISHERARAALRHLLTTQLLGHLKKRADGPDAEFRAGLIGSQIAGLALARFMIGIAPLANATEDQIVDAVGPTIQRYLTGTLSPEEPGERDAEPNVPGERDAEPNGPSEHDAEPNVPGERDAEPNVPGERDAEPEEPGERDAEADEPAEHVPDPDGSGRTRTARRR